MSPRPAPPLPGLEQFKAGRRQRRTAEAKAADGGHMPATDRQRTFLAALHAELGTPAPALAGLTRGQASALIGKARAQLAQAALRRECPTCHAAPGKPCQGKRGHARTHMHLERRTARSRTQ